MTTVNVVDVQTSVSVARASVSTATSQDTASTTASAQDEPAIVLVSISETTASVATTVSVGGGVTIVEGDGWPFLEVPGEVDTAGPVFMYLGWDGTGTDPLRVRRIQLSTADAVDATLTGTDFATLWAQRQTLNYAG